MFRTFIHNEKSSLVSRCKGYKEEIKDTREKEKLCVYSLSSSMNYCAPLQCRLSDPHNSPHNVHDLYTARWACLSASECPHSRTIVSHHVSGRMVESGWLIPACVLYTRSLKTLRERSTRQISPPSPRHPPRMAPRSTSFPSPRSPCLSPSSLADLVRPHTTPSTHNASRFYLLRLWMDVFEFSFP